MIKDKKSLFRGIFAGFILSFLVILGIKVYAAVCSPEPCGATTSSQSYNISYSNTNTTLATSATNLQSALDDLYTYAKKPLDRISLYNSAIYYGTWVKSKALTISSVPVGKYVVVNVRDAVTCPSSAAGSTISASSSAMVTTAASGGTCTLINANSSRSGATSASNNYYYTARNYISVYECVMTSSGSITSTDTSSTATNTQYPETMAVYLYKIVRP